MITANEDQGIYYSPNFVMSFGLTIVVEIVRFFKEILPKDAYEYRNSMLSHVWR